MSAQDKAAREQAVRGSYKDDMPFEERRHRAEGAASASDVWEPLLRGLLIAYEHSVEYKGKGHWLDVDNVFAWGSYVRAKKALG